MATPTDNIVPLTGNALIDGLTWGAAWDFAGGAHTLTYSLSLNDNPNGGTWTTTLSDAVRRALAEWSKVANLSFVETGSGGVYDQSPADLAILLTGNEMQSDMPGLLALGLPSSPSYANMLIAAGGGTRADYRQPEGDIALDNYASAFSHLSPGGVGLTVMIHEVGHALGLKHTDSTIDGRPSFASLGIANLDSNLYTVMSYTDAAGQGFGSNLIYGNAATPMPLDILAIQQIYGANMSYRTGDDTYQLDAVGIVQTIWDAGGSDTFSASSFSYNDGFHNASIDLRPGHYSQVGAGISRFGIAYNVVIENAVGGSGNDSLIGNDASNRLDGGAGNDTMSGGMGNDLYIVDWSQDVAIEVAGGGIDAVLASVDHTLAANVENLTLTGSAGITGRGNDLDNVLVANGGNAILIGGGGNDTFYDGGTGFDMLRGGAGSDTYFVDRSSTVAGHLLRISGEPGDYVSAGDNYIFTASTGNLVVNSLSDYGNDGLVDAVRFYYYETTGPHWFFVDIRTSQTGQNLVVGTYLDAERASSASAGHPGLDVYGDGRGSSQAFGSFSIDDVAIDYSGVNPQLLRFSATFEQHDGSPNAPALTGSIRYGEPPATITSTIVELPGEGTDQVFSSVSFALPEDVENLTLTGSNTVNGTGNSLANDLIGNVSSVPTLIEQDQLVGIFQ